MGILERAIRRGVSNAVGNAIGKAVQNAVEPKVTQLANQTAQQLDQAAASTANAAQYQAASTADAAQYQAASSTYRSTAGLESAFGSLQRSMESYATEAAKNTKVCPSCQEVTTADRRFCPACGAKLPEQTLAQGTVCPQCGKQNTIGTRFCQECGTKLPAAVAEEQAQADRNAAALASWDTLLPQYPKWACGGISLDLEYDAEYSYASFTAEFANDFEAQDAVQQYRSLLIQYGFRQAGEYPSIEHLYNKVNGICYHVDTEHCFEGDRNRPTVYFNNEEPSGGYDYVKPAPKKKGGFFDLFN